MENKIWGREDRPYDEMYMFHLKVFHWKTAEDFLEEHGLNTRLDGCVEEAFKALPDDNKYIVGVLRVDELLQNELLGHWNEINGNEVMRCWEPRHAILTVSEGKIDYCALICFECDSAMIGGKYATEKHRKLGDRSGRTIQAYRDFNNLFTGEFPEEVSSYRKSSSEW